MGANLVAEDRFSALICLFNAPGKDSLSADQARLFGAVLPHNMRAVRIYRRLRDLEIKRAAPAEQFEALQDGVLLADASARVVRANRAAKAILDARDGIFLCDGRLTVTGTSDALQKLVFSCARGFLARGGAGGELKVLRPLPRSPLQVTVMPLRSKAGIGDLPWIGIGTPVALVKVKDPDCDRQRRQINLRRRFELTPAEAALASEILKGDGRKAAARRCGISDATAKTHLSNIFEKTGTHRQAGLVRLLLDAAETSRPE
jgi:DNA-binding CsgD family transcriptional regulator